jgi:hypothetical protein
MNERRMKGSLVGPLIACGASVVFALLPIVPTLIAGAIATANGCRLDEGSPHPCIVRGSDIGHTLYSMGLMFWFGMITLPLGALGLLLSLAWLVQRAVSRR